MLHAIAFVFLIGVLMTFGFYFMTAENEKPNRWHLFAQLICTILFVLVFRGIVIDVERARTFKQSLDGNNPYRKEYTYKQVDSTYVIIDSVYVKKDN